MPPIGSPKRENRYSTVEDNSRRKGPISVKQDEDTIRWALTVSGHYGQKDYKEWEK